MLRPTALLCLAPLLACTASRGAGHDVAAVVFYDENGNGVLDADEAVRLPGVRVIIAGHAATTTAGRRAVVAGVPAGSRVAIIDVPTLPPFYTPGHSVTFDAPVAAEVALPVTLPIGANVPNTYMAFGDSLTSGAGYADDQAYRARLQSLLATHFGAAKVIDQGFSHGRSNQGAQRIGASVAAVKPAYTLILFGTNDWNYPACKQVEGCFTIRSLRRIVRAVKEAESLPCLATIPPPNVGLDHRTPPERNEWVAGIDVEIRALAREEGALLADLYAAFPPPPALKELFSDHVHPNEAGFGLMARTFFDAITGTRPPPPR